MCWHNLNHSFEWLRLCVSIRCKGILSHLCICSFLKEVGGRFRPLSEITGVCLRCKEQIDWKRKYGKYKGLTEPAKCQRCLKRNVRQAYHNLCNGCAKEQNVCAKCRCQVNQIIGSDLEEVEAEQKALEDAIRNAREREKRSLLRAMNKDKTPSSPERRLTSNATKAGDLFTADSLEDYAETNRDNGDDDNECQVLSSGN